MKNIQNDPYQWLEDIYHKDSLDWVRKVTHETTSHLESKSSFHEAYENSLSVYNDDRKIPYITQINDSLYTFKKQGTSTNGQWLRTTLDEYHKPTPQWEVILDLDILCKREKENWVWVGAIPLFPEGRFCLIALSFGGTDIKVIREFDLKKKQFIDNGFKLPPAKGLIMDGFNEIDSRGGAGWIDKDTLYIYTDFGPSSLTTAGYPRQLKQWHRGTPLSSAKTLLECKETDVMISAWTEYSTHHVRHWAARYIDFFNYELFLRQPNGEYCQVDKPLKAHIKSWGNYLFMLTVSDETIAGRLYLKGSLLVIHFDAYMQGNHNFEVLFSPDKETFIHSVTFTANQVLLTLLKNVKNVLVSYTIKNEKWTSKIIPLPETNINHIHPLDIKPYDFLLTYSDFLTPTTYALGKKDDLHLEILKSNPSYFDSSNLIVEQQIAISKDNTKIPYFIIRPKDLNLNGKNPAILYGYGGYQISMTPRYDPILGRNWLSKGGIFVVANIRGGGEFGPGWHQAAQKENRQRSFDDFIAVAEDLIDRKITSPKHLGIMGASNGGLLVCAVMIQRPELFSAVVSQVPVLDMLRYHMLLAGSSWVEEYGNPENPADRDYLSLYSPYQNVKSGVPYPPCLFETATSDDRVHPAHSRKMVAKMKEQGHQHIFYIENEEGGHGAKMSNEQCAKTDALIWVFLQEYLFSK